jgi:DNA-binding NarL/FixJ family response regulator
MTTPVRLLIADDSETIRHAICALLQPQTNIVVCGEAQDYPDLLRMLSECMPDVVLMDMRMPGEGRFDPSNIKAHLHGSCLLAMSVWNDEETISLAQRYGAFRLLDKANLASALLPAIEECIRQNGEAQSA